MYKEHGQENAVKLGFELVNPKISNLIGEIEKHISDDQVLVHCWRGGMRSSSIAWLIALTLNKKNVYVLEGGYKAYRNFVLDTFCQEYRFKIVGGYTGSGKTEVLDELSKLDQQVIDLEHLARHRGSAFGGIGLGEQPSQQNFENVLAEKLHGLDPSKPIWIEDESRRIGSRTIPFDLFALKKRSTLFFLEIPFEKRIDKLMLSYGTFNNADLVNSTAKLGRRLGLEKMNKAAEHIKNDEIQSACEILLSYYDKSYDYGLSKKQEGKISRIEFQTVSPAIIAKELVERVDDE